MILMSIRFILLVPSYPVSIWGLDNLMSLLRTFMGWEANLVVLALDTEGLGTRWQWANCNFLPVDWHWECEAGYLNACTNLQSTKSWCLRRPVHTSPPYGKLSVLLDILQFTFYSLPLCNVTAGWNGYTSSSWTDAWLTKHREREIRRQMFYWRFVVSSSVVMQSHSVSTLLQ